MSMPKFSEFVIKSVYEVIKNIKHILPKKSVSLIYVNMIMVAMDFAVAEVNDEIQNRTTKKMKVTQEEMSKLLKSRYEFHIKNQIELFKHRK